MATRARQPRIPLEELVRLPSFYVPKVSWSGDQVAFYGDRTGRNELYVMDLRSREVRQVSHGEVPRAIHAGFSWNRADRHIVFAKDRDGDEQHNLYRIDVETGEVTQLTDDPTCVEYPGEFSPDDAWLTVVTNRRRPDTPDRPGQLNVWKMRPDGSEYEPLTGFAFPAQGGGWSSDGQWISFVTNEDPSNLKNTDGYLVRPDGSDVRKVFSIRSGTVDVVGNWHPDGRRIAVATDAFGDSRVGILDVESRDVRWLSAEGIEEHPGSFSKDGRYLACLRNQESQIRPVVYEVETGQSMELDLPDGVAFGTEFILDDTRLLTTYTTATTRPSLVAYDLASGAVETLLPAEYGSIDPAIFATSRHVYYESGDGAQIPSILYVPSDLGEGERRPAIVNIHGGPTGQWFRGFDAQVQYLVDRGFVILEPNVRGSTGYGVPFRDAALKDWGGVDLEDVAAGVEYLRSLPYVDPERIVASGGSYGGYMTYVAVTKKPDVWRAGIAWVGITDLHRLYDESMEHFKYFLREQMGDPEENGALWTDRSAINFAQNLRARLLIVHGVNDPRCPISQARTFRDRLLDLGRVEGVDFEYVELGEEGHGSSDIEQKLRAFRLVADYLDRVL